MFLAFGDNTDSTGRIKYDYVFNGQQAISLILLLVAVACMPIMLAVKPMVLRRRMAKHHVSETHVR